MIGDKHDFKDISGETYREYIGPDGKPWYRIEAPQLLAVSKSGGHRVVDAAGVAHYVQPAEQWAIRWRVVEGREPFVA